VPPSDDETLALARETTRQMLPASGASSFDIGAQAAALGADVPRLFAFVRDNVREEIYAGVLRGARGALISHAANSWDKAALLGALLRQNGHEVRFARGRLSPNRASALVAKMVEQARQPPAVAAIGAADAVAARSRDVLANIDARWHAAHASLTAALDRAGVTLGRTAVAPDAVLTEEAADHAWIEYRDGDRWIPLDPSAASQPGEAVTQASETFAEIPEAMHHRVTFRVKVEQRLNQAREEHDAFVWSSSAAELHATSVILTHQIGQTPLGRWRATPVLVVDQHAYAALSFTDAGLEVPKKASDSLVGEASRQVQGVGGVAGLLGAPAPTSPPAAAAAGGELTGVRLEVEFVDPSGRSETVRRDLVDRTGAAARPPGTVSEIPSALAGIYACAITAGALDPRIVADRLATSLSALEDVTAMRKAAAGSAAPSADPERVNRMLGSLPAMLEGTAQSVHLLSQQLARRIQVNGKALVFYEATPRLAIVSLEPTASGFAIDLRRNTMRAAAVGVQGSEIARANLERGVLDGVIEDAVAGQVMATVPNTVPVSTVAILSRAGAEGIPLVAVAAPQQVTVKPQRAASGARLGWWQVDPQSGETIGVLDNGLHGAQMTERGAELQVGRAGARAMMKDGFGAADIAQAYKAGLAAGQAGTPAAVQAAMAQGIMMGIGITLAIVSYIVVGILIGRATK
jgi:hypothetical protein